MFKKADDVKSNLLLTSLSYLDFYEPTYAFFENVPGFVNFHLQANQMNLHGAKGEIEKGGIKLMIRALIDMKYGTSSDLCRNGSTSYPSSYQVRFCFLQAAHYGTPQRRVRFFLIAAKEGHKLPEFPQPTHDYPEARDHIIKYHDGERLVRINPIRSTKGIARHPVVTIWDAIGDLPQFDWFVF
jgi:DNA (cytosine-5)-methyltransferase 1